MGGARLEAPIDNITGNICPQHYICPTGSDLPQSCPIGYHANATGMWECVLCPAGYLCKPEEAPVLCPQGKCEIFISSPEPLGSQDELIGWP